MINSKITCAFPVDNTKRFICAIFDKDINNDILKIFLHPISKFHNKTPEQASGISTFWYAETIKRIDGINAHIKNNKYEFELCNEENIVVKHNAHLLKEYKNITHFELAELTKQLSLTKMSKKLLSDRLKEQHNKYLQINEITEALMSDKLNQENLKQLQAILGITK